MPTDGGSSSHAWVVLSGHSYAAAKPGSYKGGRTIDRSLGSPPTFYCTFFSYDKIKLLTQLRLPYARTYTYVYVYAYVRTCASDLLQIHVPQDSWQFLIKGPGDSSSLARH